MTLHRYWIEFDFTAHERPPMAATMGFGVTEHSIDDALASIRAAVFGGRPLPRTKHIREHVDVSTLDERHVRPNMGNPAVRGIWFPVGFEQV